MDPRGPLRAMATSIESLLATPIAMAKKAVLERLQPAGGNNVQRRPRFSMRQRAMAAVSLLMPVPKIQ